MTDATEQFAGSYNIAPPEPFNFRRPEEWPRWYRRFNRFRESTGLCSQSQERQVSLLLYSMGDEAEDIVSSFGLSEEDALNYDRVKDRLEKYFIPRRNVIYERARFNQRRQEEGEMVDSFVTALYSLSEYCGFGQLRDEMIRDRIVVGLLDSKVSETLQLDPGLTLETAISKARQKEAVINQQAVVRPEMCSSNENCQVARIQSKFNKLGGSKKEYKGRDWLKRATSKKTALSPNQNQYSNRQERCQRCGRYERHVQRDCPAKEATCHKCKKKGHYSTVCLSKAGVHMVQEKVDALFLGAITDNSKNDPWSVEVDINGYIVKFKLDCGADITAIPKGFKCQPKQLRASTKALFGPEGKQLNVVGIFPATMRINEKISKQDIYVVENLAIPLLGRPTIEDMGLLQRVCEVTEVKQKYHDMFPKLFKGLGLLEGDYDIKLKSDAQPFSISTPRRIPIPLMTLVKQELERMESLGVISKVDIPTEWCAGMVVVPKKGDAVRICVDLTQLNKSVMREKHILPTVEQSLAQLSGAKVFTKLDANSGFWQIKLTEQSRQYTTFITPFGRYCFNRLPFGISSAPEHFQKRMQRELEGFPGVVCQIDDVLVFGNDHKTHDDHLLPVLEKLEASGITLNDKCEFEVESVEFLGNIIDSTGVHPSPDKIRAIVEMKPPESVTEVRRFLGMVNHVGRFIPHLSDKTKPLRDLLVKTNSWTWGNAQEEAFRLVKDAICQETSLALYDPKLVTIVMADASSYGIGAVLLQVQPNGNRKAVAFASKSLTATEQRYAQVEKEALAITWACERFSTYLIGLSFHIETDHKPLVALLGSMSLDVLPPRIQRLRMRLMRFEFSISHVPGKNMATADTLSRAPVGNSGKEDDSFANEVEAYVASIVEKMPATNTKLKEIEKKQDLDPECQRVKEYCIKGWPDKNKVPANIVQFWQVRYELTVVQGLLLKGCRIVIPNNMRKEILTRLHEGHQGITKCRTRAQESVWWPGISKDVQSVVEQCNICLSVKRNSPEPLITTETPPRPWQRLGSDLFQWNGRNYLLVVDYYSRYIEIALLSGTTSANIIVHLKSIFARHGLPEILITDNGPQYVSKEFAEFTTRYEIKHITSSPHFPQSNGEAERAVKTVKRLLQSGDNYDALLAYRTTPLANGFSPSELLMGRKLRTMIPVIPEMLKPKIPDSKMLFRKEKQIKQRQIKNYNARHRVQNLDNLEPGTPVFVKDYSGQATVERKAETPRSYIIQTPNGLLRRNRRDLVPKHQGSGTDILKQDTGSQPVQSQQEQLLGSSTTPSRVVSDCFRTRSGRISVPPKRLTYS